jgi:uncharacterized protein (DUF58 family)
MYGPNRTSLRATFGFALLLGVTALSLLFAWIGTEALALVSAAGVVLTVLAPLGARLNLSGLKLMGPGGHAAFAGLTAPLELNLERRRLMPARDLLVIVEDGRRRGAPPTGHLARIGHRRASVRCLPRFAERGRRQEVTVAVESSFPLGLFVARAEFTLPIDLLVLPRITRLGALARSLRSLAGSSQAAPHGRRGWGEFHALHEWREGEPLHGVAWKPSARRGRLLLREVTSEDEPALRVVLQTRVQGLTAGTKHPLFERAVQLAASLLDDRVRRGRAVALSLEGETAVHLPPLRGRGDLRHALTALAEIEATPGTPLTTWHGVSETPIVILVGGGIPILAPEQGLVIDVESPTGGSVFEASARAGMRRGLEMSP